MSQILTPEQARTALGCVSEGFCPFGHGPLRPDLDAGGGWCDTCTAIEGVETGYRTVPGWSGLAWTGVTRRLDEGAAMAAETVASHIGYWDRSVREWRLWCEVYGEELMPKPPTEEVCADCFALAVGEMEDADGDR